MDAPLQKAGNVSPQVMKANSYKGFDNKVENETKNSNIGFKSFSLGFGLLIKIVQNKDHCAIDNYGVCMPQWKMKNQVTILVYLFEFESWWSY